MKHSRKLISNYAFPRSIALLFTALSCVSTTASADEPAYTMTTIADSAHGAEIAAGKYEQAIEKIAAIDDDVDTFLTIPTCVSRTPKRVSSTMRYLRATRRLSKQTAFRSIGGAICPNLFWKDREENT